MRVLEVGSKYIYGSIRPLIEKHMRPKEYIGIDIKSGKFVDLILSAEKIIEHFGKETFAIEPYKKPAIYNLLNNRTLVIMGYSGSDDFDIGPMLKELPFLNKIIWIEHSQESQTEILRVNKIKNTQNGRNLTQSEQILVDIRESGDFEVYLIRTHTNNFIKNSLWKRVLPNISIKDLNL